MINEAGEVICTGRYSGKKPKQAASKACTRIYETYEEKNHPEKVVFGMHECSRSSKKKKKYYYVGRRVALKTPEEVVINKIDQHTGNRVVIKYYFNNDVKKLTDIEGCPQYTTLLNYDSQHDMVFASSIDQPTVVPTIAPTIAPIVVADSLVPQAILNTTPAISESVAQTVVKVKKTQKSNKATKKNKDVQPAI